MSGSARGTGSAAGGAGRHGGAASVGATGGGARVEAGAPGGEGVVDRTGAIDRAGDIDRAGAADRTGAGANGGGGRGAAGEILIGGGPPRPPLDPAALRAREFAALGDTAYLNSASTGPYPTRSLDAIAAFDRLRAEPHRITLEMQLGTLARARALAARLIGADADEIALAHNTSDGINLAARALPFTAGDVVVASDGEFPANVYPWMALAPRGVRLELVPRRGDLPDEEALVAALDRPGVRALAVSWVSFSTGYRVDLARLGRECRARGVWLVVDGIQGVGTVPLDVRACHVDVLACGAPKWLLSPWGTGFTYVRRELVRELDPPAAGWLQVRGAEDFGNLTDYDLAWRDDARRFEVGTLPYQDYAATCASLELLLELGVDAVAAHVASLVDLVVEWATSRGPGVRLVTPAERERRAGIVTLALPDAAGASARLAGAGVVHSLREGALRLSPHCFNTLDDVERALGAIEEAPRGR